MHAKPERPVYGDVRTGALIREIRRARGVSQLELGRAAGCSEQLIGAIERGTRAATPDVKKAISEYLALDFPGIGDLDAAIQRLTEAYKAAEAAGSAA